MHIHHQTIGVGLETDFQVGTAIISGSMVDAHQILDKLAEQDVVYWTAIISKSATSRFLSCFSKCKKV
jgi:hypothetical protein